MYTWLYFYWMLAIENEVFRNHIRLSFFHRRSTFDFSRKSSREHITFIYQTDLKSDFGPCENKSVSCLLFSSKATLQNPILKSTEFTRATLLGESWTSVFVRLTPWNCQKVFNLLTTVLKSAKTITETVVLMSGSPYWTSLISRIFFAWKSLPLR